MSDNGGTVGMLGSMLGLGNMLSQIQDPAFLASAKAIVDMIVTTNQRCERIERLLLELYNVRVGQPIPVLAQLGCDGTGQSAAASRAADDGTPPNRAAVAGFGVSSK